MVKLVLQNVKGDHLIHGRRFEGLNLILNRYLTVPSTIITGTDAPNQSTQMNVWSSRADGSCSLSSQHYACGIRRGIYSAARPKGAESL
jgi:hypothetical protein